MTQFAEKYRVESARLKNWDYSSPGIYFITICAVHKNRFFGKIVDGQMVLSSIGDIVKFELLKTFELRQNVELLEYIIMPNHVHILMKIKYHLTHVRRDVARYVSTDNNQKNSTKKINKIMPLSLKPGSISAIIRSLKSAVTRSVNPKTTFFAWQPRFYDVHVRDEEQLQTIKYYILNNPRNWQKDKLYSLE